MTRRVALLFSVAWTLSASPARSQDDPGVNLPPNGSQLFRALLDFTGVRPSTVPEGRIAGDIRPIVIVYGAPANALLANNIQTRTRNALIRGGAVLIVTDRSLDVPDYMPNTAGEAFVRPASVRHPSKHFGGFPDCPFVSPGSAINLGGLVKGNVVVTAEQNPFAGLNNVATNKPGVLHVSRKLPVPGFAVYYPGTEFVHRNAGLRINDFTPCFAAGQDLGYTQPSRWAAMADDDVLSNALLAANGTDNFVLAYQLVNWLRGPEGRTECFFYEYGTRVDKFDEVKFMTMPDIPGPPLPDFSKEWFHKIQRDATDGFNHLLDDVQSKDQIHNKLVGGQAGYARWLRVLAVVAAGASAFYLLRRAFAARQAFPGPITMPHGDGPPGTLLAVLRQEMVRGNNFTPAVTAYIEETFRIAGLSDGPHDQMPQVAITGKKVKHVELMSEIARLWKVLYGPGVRPPMHYAAWRDLEPAADNVRHLAVKGRWRFLLPGGAA